MYVCMYVCMYVYACFACAHSYVDVSCFEPKDMSMLGLCVCMYVRMYIYMRVQCSERVCACLAQFFI